MDPYIVRLVIRRPDADAEADTTTVAKKDSPKSFSARWVEADGQMSEVFELTPPMGEKEAEDLRWYLEQYHEFVGAGTRARANGIVQRIEEWGKQLFKALFNSMDGMNVYRNILEAEKTRRPVLLTLGTKEPRVLAQPWELLRDDRGPLAFRDVSIRRQLEGAKPMQTLELKLPLRLLLIVSRPTDAGFIDPRTSVRPLLDGLDQLPRGAVEVELCEPPTLAELEERISQARRTRNPFHIVHFDGHGTYLSRLGVGALCFENEDRTTSWVPGPDLGDLISRLDVPLVILEACRTSSLAEMPVAGSVAPALLASGVGSVVAFSHAIHIEASRILVERFYRELAAGMSVGQAVAEARVGLKANSRRWLSLGPKPPTVKLQDWFVPQLYQIGPDLTLLADDASLGTTSEPELVGEVLVGARQERLHGFPPEPTYRFQGRAKELLELERAFERHHGVVLAAMGGMGKTALAREAAAWWLRTGRFETAVFCSFEQVRGTDRVAQLLGNAVEGLDFDKRPGAEQLDAAVEMFQRRRILLVWDNFESTLPHFQDAGSDGETGGVLAFDDEERSRLKDFYRRLTAGKPAGRLLVTCRPEETGLPRIKKLALAGLARHDSLHLVTAVADLEGFDLERDGYDRPQVEALLDDLQDHPLSISLVAPHLAQLTPEAIRTDFAGHLGRFAVDGSEEGRNRSLLASLAFSTARLSEEARAVLPFLAWFRSGAFEIAIINFTGLEASVWADVRRQLEATALVRVEEVPGFKPPYLRFHPTLPFAAQADQVPGPAAAEERFLAVYLNVSREVAGALHGQNPAAGMELMAREEANVRAAIDRAFRRSEYSTGGQLADTLQLFLEMAGRRRERNTLASWVREQLPADGPLDDAACAAIRSDAQALVARGHSDEAVAALRELVARLKRDGLAGGEDATFQLGRTYQVLGQTLVSARQPRAAVDASRRAIELLESAPGDAARVNLSAALGDLANALRQLGRHGEALVAAERGVAILEELQIYRDAAAGHGICARLLRALGRHGEADARYDIALAHARQAGDLELQGTTLQHQGGLSQERGDLARSATLFEEAIGLFRQAKNVAAEMQTYNLLGATESNRGHLDAAAAWYERARELAEELDDRVQLGAIAGNVGTLLQIRAKRVDSPAEQQVLLRRAVASVEESLAIWIERKDQVFAAKSHSHLGQLYHLLGDLDRAEAKLLEGLAINEPLNLPDVWRGYADLATVAEARGDAEAAAAWAAKRDAKLAELRRLAGNDRPSALPEEVAQSFLGLAQAVHAARAGGTELPAEVAEVLAQLTEQPEPFATVGRFLRAVADGENPPIPDGLPEPLPEILGGLLAALE